MTWTSDFRRLLASSNLDRRQLISYREAIGVIIKLLNPVVDYERLVDELMAVFNFFNERFFSSLNTKICQELKSEFDDSVKAGKIAVSNI